MNRKIQFLHYTMLLCYSALVSLILVLTKAPMLAVAAVLLLGPILVIWQQVDLRSRLVPIVSGVMLLCTAIIQIFAYIHGLWYEISPMDLRPFGAAPLEAYIFSATLILYLVVVYEYFFDDKKGRVKTTYVARLVMLLSILLALALGYIYLFADAVISNAYSALVAALMLLLVVIIGEQHSKRRWSLLVKAAGFSLFILPISMMSELIMLANDLRFFANYTEYLFVFSYFGYTVPIEEMIMLLLLPMTVVLLYEALFDDNH